MIVLSLIQVFSENLWLETYIPKITSKIKDINKEENMINLFEKCCQLFNVQNLKYFLRLNKWVVRLVCSAQMTSGKEIEKNIWRK